MGQEDKKRAWKEKMRLIREREKEQAARQQASALRTTPAPVVQTPSPVPTPTPAPVVHAPAPRPTPAPMVEPKTINQADEVYTLPEACKLLKLSRSTMDRLGDTIPGRFKLGGQVRYHGPTLREFLASLIKKNKYVMQFD